MSFHYSQPFEALLTGSQDAERALTARVVIVGSGYGGAVAAWRLSGRSVGNSLPRDHDVLVLERGAEYLPGEFPTSLQDVAGFMGMQRAGRPDTVGDDSLFSLRSGDGVDVLVGHGLGGTSLINANVAALPKPAVFQQAVWPKAIREEAAQLQGSKLGQAFDAVRRCLDITAAISNAELERLDKYQAFAHFAESLGFPVGPAPIAVTLGDAPRRNHFGVMQTACTRCGNCVSGCNVGAKNTLAMNFIPAAHARGARFVTGALAMTVRPIANAAADAPRWRVNARPSSRATRARLAVSDLSIDADIVILAAGTLGSTEILQRSQQAGEQWFSSQLGKHFSTNGDALAASFAERDPVAAIGAVDYRQQHATGPTITALADGVTPAGELFTLEDGAVPAAIAPLVGEVLTTAAQLQRLGNNRLPAWFRHGQGGSGLDPIDVHLEALQRGQIFLVMGHDGAAGELKYNAAGDGAAEPVWPSQEDPERGWRPALARISDTLATQDRGFGLHGGQFVPNPGFQPLPAAAMGVASGSKAMGGRLVTVHPLGGCRMADSGADGVVNHVGAVFRGNSSATWDGLHVLDGAIVPTSLGINPFLTIAALAWRACDTIGATLGPEPAAPAAVRQLPPNQRVPASANSADYPIVVRERLIGALDAGKVSGAANGINQLQQALPTLNVRRWFECDGLVLQIETDPQDARRLIAGGKPVRLAARLYQNPANARDSERLREHHVDDDELTPASLVAAGTGTLTIMTENRPGNVWEFACRLVGVTRAFFRRRQSLASLLRAAGARRGSPGTGILAFVRASLSLARMHTTFRDFNYEVALEVPGTKARSATRIGMRGTKRISWHIDAPRLWEALLALPATVTITNGSGTGVVSLRTSACLNVDTTYLLGTGLVKFEPAADNHSPLGAFNVFAFVTRFARSILQSSFWEFGAPDYPDTISDEYQPDRDLPLQLNVRTPGGVRLHAERVQVPDRRAEKSRGTLSLQLGSYRHSPEPAPRGPVLLLHGLAQGSKIYAHPAMGTGSMAAFLFDQGYDVWLYDYRLSNIFDRQTVPYGRWTIDDIAEFDIPAGVQRVLQAYPAGTRLQVFAHCVGAIATEMAILKGWITREQIASVALNAIHPWTMASPANRARASALGPLRDALDDNFFNPVIETNDKIDATHTLLDRLASSIARLGESPPGHPQQDTPAFAGAICDRMTLMYGRMWRHDKSRAVHGRWIDLVGSSPATVQRQIYYLLLNSRLANHWGENVYLTEENIERRWRGIRTFFVHGNLSDVFNAESASRSADRLNYALNLKPGAEHAAPTPVLVKRFDGLGHMDVILADEAASEGSVFPLLHQFFSGTLDGKALDRLSTEEDVHADANPALRAGPVLRGALIEGGRLKLRVWGQLPDMNTVTPTGMRIGASLPQTDISPAPGDDGVASWYYRWADVALDPAQFAPLDAEATFPRSTDVPSSYALSPADNAALPWLRRLQLRAAGRPVRDAHFIVASCRYPGLMVDREQPDQVFAGMQRVLRGDTGLDCDLVFFIGDQIYADATAGLADPKLWRDRFLDRYREAFSCLRLREVLRSIPVHFAIDDHEIADNYSGYVGPRAQFWNDMPWHVEAEDQGIVSGEVTADELAFALRAAYSYQGSRREAVPFGRAPVAAGRFWYALDHDVEARFPTFVTDTRSERLRATATAPARLMSDAQLAALLQWLRGTAALNLPKFIFSGSVIAPLTRDAFAPGALLREDGLVAYPLELEQIVALIVELDIRHVVFVGGDLHISATAALDLVRHSDGRSVRALQLVSSGLYAPLPFVNTSRDSIDWKGHPDAHRRIPLGGHAIEYAPELLTDSNGHFVHVSAVAHGEAWQITARALDRNALPVATQHDHLL
jgi:cholesterol oxidase